MVLFLIAYRLSRLAQDTFMHEQFEEQAAGDVVDYCSGLTLVAEADCSCLTYVAELESRFGLCNKGTV